MSPLERAVVERKLQHLRELVLLLRQESGRSLESFLADRREQLLVERLLHLAVEAATDLLEHLLVQASQVRPQTYADTFLQAGQQGWISMELAQRLVPAAGLRNRLVHDYEAIDPGRVYDAMAIALANLDALLGQLAARMAI
jgi:uncharacterized protein YutE (UPF0331/DUF86 family)